MPALRMRYRHNPVNIGDNHLPLTGRQLRQTAARETGDHRRRAQDDNHIPGADAASAGSRIADESGAFRLMARQLTPRVRNAASSNS